MLALVAGAPWTWAKESVAMTQPARKPSRMPAAIRSDRLEARLFMIPPIQVRTAQVRTAQVRTAQVRTAQVRTAQVRTAQVRTAQVRPTQVRPTQVRTPQVRTATSGPGR